MDAAKLALTALSGADDSESASSFEFPSPGDVLEVKAILLNASALPLEIIDWIIDAAKYWPRTTVSTAGETFSAGGHRNSKKDTFILRTLPLGYFLGRIDHGEPTLPMRSYVMEKNIAHEIEISEAVTAMTSDLLSQWKSQSAPRGMHPCRKVVITIKSKDQGWVDTSELRGIYDGSYTWFDVGLEKIQVIDKNICTPEIQIPQGFMGQFHLESRSGASIYCDLQTVKPCVIEERGCYSFDHPPEPASDRIQSNRTGTEEVKEHTVTWVYDDCVDPLSTEGDQLEQEGRGRDTGNGNFVRNLQVGDIITIWARARYPGWRNDVKDVKVDVYWAV